MNFFELNVALFKEVHIGEADHYFLHVVTFCDNTSYYADGHEIDNSRVGEEILDVEIIISENTTGTSLPAPNPVVHTIELGTLPFEEGEIEVFLDRGNKPKKKVSTTSAVVIERPIGSNSVKELWDATFNTDFSI